MDGKPAPTIEDYAARLYVSEVDARPALPNTDPPYEPVNWPALLETLVPKDDSHGGHPID